MKNFQGFIYLGLILIFLFSCETENDFDLSTTEEVEELIPVEGMTILGRQLPNPYSPENIQKAWESLENSNSKLTKGIQMNFQPTHYYVKFIPTNFQELETLKANSNYDIYDYPTDYEVIKEGSYYHDPEVDVSMPTYQYALIEKDTELPSQIDYIILDELIQFQYINNDPLISVYGEDLIYALEDESFKLVGLQEYLINENTKRRWRPGGQILKAKWNYGAYTAPVSGLSVKILNLWRYQIGSATTDNNGNFSSSMRFRTRVRYKITYTANNRTSDYTSSRTKSNWNIEINLLNTGYSNF